ncbi:MAG TPA: hypothetical protein VFQ53_15455 [Kofleriaceae bacterium]|nr:hypothetical protein [Kofleriaceae bacterium]
MSALIRSLVIVALVALAIRAHAAPANARVVLVDSDPELLHALATTLAPWKLEVIVDSEPVTAETAGARADSREARFVVWREGTDLVVFDRERGETEHREARAGALDPVTAAAAALTVKTLMRLPPPPPDDTAPITPPPPEEGGVEVRVQAGLATRLARGSETAVGARFAGAALVRPWADYEWRFGVAFEGGTTAAVQRAGFKGTWSDWSLLALAGWAHEVGPIEIEPYVAAGFTRSHFYGDEMTIARDESATLATIGAGAWVRWRVGMWSVGGVVGLDALPGTPTYTKTASSTLIYEVPSITMMLGLVLAADLGR